MNWTKMSWEDEVLNAIRASGGRDVADVGYLVLECDGTMSVSLRNATAKRPE